MCCVHYSLDGNYDVRCARGVSLCVFLLVLLACCWWLLPVVERCLHALIILSPQTRFRTRVLRTVYYVALASCVTPTARQFDVSISIVSHLQLQPSLVPNTGAWENSFVFLKPTARYVRKGGGGPGNADNPYIVSNSSSVGMTVGQRTQSLVLTEIEYSVVYDPGLYRYVDM